MLSQHPLTHRQAFEEWCREWKEYAIEHPWSTIIQWVCTIGWYGFLVYAAQTKPIFGCGLLLFVISIRLAAYLDGRKGKIHGLTRKAEREFYRVELREAYERGKLAGRAEA